VQSQHGHAGYTQAGFTQQQQQQQVSEGGTSMQFLDLDATRAYALGVHQVMLKLEQGMQSLHSQSEASSRPTTPRGSSAFADAAGAGADGAAAAAAVQQAQQETEGLNTCRSRAHLQSAEQSPAKPPGEELQEQQQEASDGEEQDLQQQQSARGRATGDGSPAEERPLGAARAAPLRVEASDAGGMPPLRSGMSSPAASRYVLQEETWRSCLLFVSCIANTASVVIA
jgi:hypothetical protein